MELRPEFQTPSSPFFQVHQGDKDEVERIQTLESNLRAVRSYCERVVADVALFEFCLTNPGAHLRDWLFLAGRDGAMSLRNYRDALSTVRGLIGLCPSIAPSIDVKALKLAEGEFSERFPRVEKLRHAVAHPEHYRNPQVKMSSDEGVNLPGFELPPGNIVEGSLIGNNFVNTINGLTVGWEISSATSLALIKITKDIFNAFVRLDPLGSLRLT